PPRNTRAAEAPCLKHGTEPKDRRRCHFWVRRDKTLRRRDFLCAESYKARALSSSHRRRGELRRSSFRPKYANLDGCNSVARILFAGVRRAVRVAYLPQP